MRTPSAHTVATRLGLVVAAAALLAACAGSAALPDRGPSANEGTGGAMPYPPAAPSAGPADGQGGAGSDTGASLQMVYTGSLDLVVADVDRAVAGAKAAVSDAGGYVGASRELANDGRPVAVVTFRIPVAKWDATVSSLRALATKVLSEQMLATEVGGQIVDLQARLANLRASEAALQEIARHTAKVSDLLEVQAQLTDVRGQIEVIDAQLQRLKGQIAYGTLEVTFGVEVEQVTTAAKGWDPASDVDAALAALILAGQRLATGVIWFGILWVPFLLAAAVILLVVVRLLRRFGPRPAAKSDVPQSWTAGPPTPPETPSR